VSGPFSGTANLPIGILDAAKQQIGPPGLLRMASQEMGDPEGFATASGLPPSVLRVGVVNSDFQPGRSEGDILLFVLHRGQAAP
jgi:hypothetical protein